MTDARPSRVDSSPLAKALTAVTVTWLFLAMLRRGRGAPRRGQVAPPAAASAEAISVAGWATTPAEDLATDRRFERSLVLRQFVVVLGIAILIALRQLAS